MKKFAMVLAALLTGLSTHALAHGDAQAMHGGIVQVASDIQYELVAQQDGAALYVVDHGKPADVGAMSGKLTVLNGTQKSEATLKPAGGNKLEAVQVRIAAGSKVVARIDGANGKATTVRFVIK